MKFTLYNSGYDIDLDLKNITTLNGGVTNKEGYFNCSLPRDCVAAGLLQTGKSNGGYVRTGKYFKPGRGGKWRVIRAPA